MNYTNVNYYPIEGNEIKSNNFGRMCGSGPGFYLDDFKNYGINYFNKYNLKALLLRFSKLNSWDEITSEYYLYYDGKKFYKIMDDKKFYKKFYTLDLHWQEFEGITLKLGQ